MALRSRPCSFASLSNVVVSLAPSLTTHPSESCCKADPCRSAHARSVSFDAFGQHDCRRADLLRGWVRVSLVPPTLGRDSTGRRKRLRGWRAGGEAAPGSPRFASRVSGSPMSRRPGGRRDRVRRPARAPRKAPAGQGRPTGAAVTLQAPRRSPGGPPGRQEAPRAGQGARRPPIRSQEVATARQGARRRHEAGRSARGRLVSPWRSPHSPIGSAGL